MSVPGTAEPQGAKLVTPAEAGKYPRA